MLIITKPVLLRTVTELLLHKPTNLSEVEMTRGVKHVSKILIKVKYVLIIKDEVIFIQALIIQLYSQDYLLTSKILVTKCNNKYVEMWNAYLSSLLLIGTISLINLSVKDRISDFVLRIGDPLTQEIGINTKRLLTLVWLIYILPKGDGVIVVPFGRTSTWEELQELVINRIRTGRVCLKLNDPIGIFSKQINMQERRFSSSKSIGETLNPYFVTGFIDGEGCFNITVHKDNRLNIGWRVRLSFQIGLHEKDITLLEQIQLQLAYVGNIYKLGPKSVQFVICSIKDLAVIIEHLDKYPLITHKRGDYELWKQVFYLMERGEHLTAPEGAGLEKIVAIKSSMNRGLSSNLKVSFPEIVPVFRSSRWSSNIEDPYWLAGFVAGEGCFSVDIFKSKKYSVGFQVRLRFIITQHIRDEELLRSLVTYLRCGNYNSQASLTWGNFNCSNFSDIINKIIPFFTKYPIIGVKALDFADWCKVAELMKNKTHLITEGLEEIRKIKAGMNTGRESNESSF